jgi:transposase
LSGNRIKQLKANHISPLLAGQEDLEPSGEVSKNAIDYLSGKIGKAANVVLKKIKLRKPFPGLQTIPGLGRILSMIGMKYTRIIIPEKSRFKSIIIR